ncbi:MAG: bifunctional riboflavin kinase/FAD synthetase [Dehalococcoidales bacterium]|nr:bifunctional riboflavin kinase/FAD synthetase [Dehalococcoidales bacterium]
MSLENDLADFTSDKGTYLTIGVFDGVHLGHKSLLSELIKRAKQKGLESGVITFKRHPRRVVNPGNELQFLTNLQLKIKLIKEEGVDFVVPLTFTKEIAGISASDFISLLQKHLKMQGLIVGPDFALGNERQGDISFLRNLAQSMNFEFSVIPPFKNSVGIISSTAIRNALSAGDMVKASHLLGRYFSIEGEVVQGTGTGKKIGFPTANLYVDSEQALPLEGIYATRTLLDGQCYNSVTFIGKRVTFGDTKRTIETHLIDYNGDLYHKNLKIDIIYRLRSEIKFDSADELAEQIRRDAAAAKDYLNNLNRK